MTPIENNERTSKATALHIQWQGQCQIGTKWEYWPNQYEAKKADKTRKLVADSPRQAAKKAIKGSSCWTNKAKINKTMTKTRGKPKKGTEKVHPAGRTRPKQTKGLVEKIGRSIKKTTYSAFGYRHTEVDSHKPLISRQ